MRDELLTEAEEFPRCIKCRARDAHRSEMRDITAGLPEELKPRHPVYLHRECSGD